MKEGGGDQRAGARIGIAAGAAVVLGAAIRLALGLRDLGVLDALFIPDDTYYTLAIARSLAAGLGPTADGIVLTNGFQPLLAFLLVPVFWLTQDPDAALRAAILIGAASDAASVHLLYRIGARTISPVAGVLAAAFWSVSPLALGNALNGLETSLSLAAVLGALVAWDSVGRNARLQRFTLVGLVWGTALLARVDTALIVVLFGLVLLFRREWGPLFFSMIGALCVVLPWWLSSTVMFGSPVPESGAAVREITRLHRELYLGTPGQIAWALGTVVQAPCSHSRAFREEVWAVQHSAGILALIYCAAVVSAGFALSRLRPPDARPPLLPVLAGWAMAVFAFYVWYVPAVWFYPRYLLPVAAVVTLFASGLLAVLFETLRDGRLRTAGAVVGMVLMIPGGTAALGFLSAHPDGTVDTWLHGAKGYRRAALEVYRSVPPGSVVGSLQTGALEYYAPPGVRVVNLDGVVDRHAARAFRDGNLGEYARSRGMTHLADWPFNYENFVRRGGEAARRARFTEVARAFPQGRDVLVLASVEW